MSSAFPFVEISGSSLARGRSYGEAMRERVAMSANLYRKRLAGLGLGDPAALIHRFIPEIEAFGAHYLEEMQGIADGARLPLEDVVLINCRTEIVAMARLREAKPDGCTGLVILPERSSTGEVIHAQNWDWLAECAKTAIVLAIRRDDGPDILTFTEAGGLALSKLKEAGLHDVPESLYRDWRVRKLLPEGLIGIDDVKRALADDFGAPFSVCRPPFDPDAGSLSATVATIIMEPSRRQMQIAPMPAEGAKYTRYAL